MKKTILFSIIISVATPAMSMFCTDVLKSEQKYDLSKSLLEKNRPGEYKTVISPKGHKVAYELSLSGDAKAPLLVYVNGQMYGLHGYREFSHMLNLNHIDTVSISFSVQPESLSKMSEKEQLKVVNDKHNLDSLADEILAVIHAVKKPNQKVTLGALSFGSSVIPTILRKEPKLIDQTILMAPLAITGELYPKETAQMKSMENLMRLNPFTAPYVIDGMREYVTKNYVSSVFSNSKVTDLFDVDVKKDIVEKGLVKLTRAAEEFNLIEELKDIKSDINFMVSGKDDESRLRNQLTAYFNQRGKTQKGSLLIVPMAEHAKVFNFSTILATAYVANLIHGKFPSELGVLFAKHETRDLIPLKENTVETTMNGIKILNEFYENLLKKHNAELAKKNAPAAAKKDNK